MMGTFYWNWALFQVDKASGTEHGGNWKRRWFSPNDPRAALFMGEVLWKLERRSEVLTSLREAIRLNPADWQPHYRLAQDLTQQGDLSEAATEYLEALRLNPANLKTKVGLAAVLPNLGHREEALQLLGEVLQLEPTNGTARISKGKFAETESQQSRSLL